MCPGLSDDLQQIDDARKTADTAPLDDNAFTCSNCNRASVRGSASTATAGAAAISLTFTGVNSIVSRDRRMPICLYIDKFSLTYVS